MKYFFIIIGIGAVIFLIWRFTKTNSVEGNQPVEKTETELIEIAADENPWGVPVIDLRPFTHNVMATTTDPQNADNALSYGGDSGESFFSDLSEFENEPQIECDLRYSLGNADRLLPGVLFTPASMDEKWAIFCDETRIVFVRSWLREVAAVAKYHCKNGEVIVTELSGGFSTGATGSLLEAELDYIIRTHVLGDEHPVPMEAITASKAMGVLCFSPWGNKASFAAKHPMPTSTTESLFVSNSLLHIALAQNEEAKVLKLLESGFPIDSLAQDGLTTLHWASVSGSLKMVKLLLNQGCPIDVRSREEVTVLMNEAQDGDADTLKFYLSKGADPNAVDARGFTALHRCSEMGREDLVSILLKGGADPNISAEGNTPISLAESRGNHKIVELLKGENPDK